VQVEVEVEVEVEKEVEKEVPSGEVAREAEQNTHK